VGLPFQRDDVAPQEQLAVQMSLQRAQDVVLAAGQLRGDRVGELDLGAVAGGGLVGHQWFSASLTCCDTRRPSARPATSDMTSGMTLPMSFGEVAPLRSTAPATISRS